VIYVSRHQTRSQRSGKTPPWSWTAPRMVRGEVAISSARHTPQGPSISGVPSALRRKDVFLDLVSQNFASWNRIGGLLARLDSLRHAA
jgi:hypothetical protein